MRKLLYILCLLALTATAQQDPGNCWYSTDYYYMTSKKSGYKKVKDVEAYACIKDYGRGGTVSFFTKETGLVTFEFMTTYSGIDSLHDNQVVWQGLSGEPGSMYYGEYVIDMTYNHTIRINHTMRGSWCVQMNAISHTAHGRREFSKGK